MSQIPNMGRDEFEEQILNFTHELSNLFSQNFVSYFDIVLKQKYLQTNK